MKSVYTVTTVFLLTAAAFAADSPVSKTRAVKQLLQALDSSDSPGLAVLVMKDGEKVFNQGYGVYSLAAKTARKTLSITPQTNFRLASVTKQFTATAIMLLVREGKLRYDEKLTAIFPDFPAYGNKITVRNVLNHTAGLLDYEDLMGPQYNESNQITDAEVLALLEKQDHTKFASGSNWEYSNSGYVLLGKVVERVSGITFPDFLRQRIFLPLGMTQTVAYVKNMNKVPNRAFGYSREHQLWKDTDQSSTSATLGDGGVYSSLDDLAKWYAAMDRHALLTESEMMPAFAPVKLAGGATREYGFAWYLDSYHGHRRMHHDGTTSGFHNYVERFPAERLTIVVLANRTDIDVHQLADRIAEVYLEP